MLPKRRREPMPTDILLDEWFACPGCGHADTLDGYGVGGADEGNVFCSGCTAEVSLDSLRAIDPGPYLLAKLAEKYPGISEELDTIAVAYAARVPVVRQAELF
jgi:hypothetical protein